MGVEDAMTDYQRTETWLVIALIVVAFVFVD
jgi:hypothetical protein